MDIAEKREKALVALNKYGYKLSSTFTSEEHGTTYRFTREDGSRAEITPMSFDLHSESLSLFIFWDDIEGVRLCDSSCHVSMANGATFVTFN